MACEPTKDYVEQPSQELISYLSEQVVATAIAKHISELPETTFSGIIAGAVTIPYKNCCKFQKMICLNPQRSM